MKKLIIIIGSLIITAIVLLRISYVHALSTLNSEPVQSVIGEFKLHNSKLSTDPITGELCWIFIQASWHEAYVINISLWGDPISYGKLKELAPNQGMDLTR